MRSLFVSYADDMVLSAPTFSALQKLLDICNNLALPDDIVYNTFTTVCVLIRPKGPTFYFSADLSASAIGHIVSADKDDANQTRRQNVAVDMLIGKVAFAPKEANIQYLKLYCYPMYCNALRGDFYQYNIRELRVSYKYTFQLSEIVFQIIIIFIRYYDYIAAVAKY